MAADKNADAAAAAAAKEEALAKADAEAVKAVEAAAAKQAALEEAAAADPRPDDMLEVVITGKCTLGPGGLEKIGGRHILPRVKVPKSAARVVRTVKRGAAPKKADTAQA